MRDDFTGSAGESGDFFKRFGLEVKSGEVEVGKSYPIYGVITKFFNETPGEVEVELNYNIRAHLAVPSEDKVEILRQRAFEPGIFVSKIVSKDEGVTVDCSTVIFGKRPQYQS